MQEFSQLENVAKTDDYTSQFTQIQKNMDYLQGSIHELKKFNVNLKCGQIFKDLDVMKGNLIRLEKLIPKEVPKIQTTTQAKTDNKPNPKPIQKDSSPPNIIRNMEEDEKKNSA